MITLIAFIVLLWAWPIWIDALEDGEETELERQIKDDRIRGRLPFWIDA